MNWKVLILAKAEKDLTWFRKHDRSLYIKCFDVVRDIVKDPRRGLGKPERLKYFDREVWSRRISRQHRLVYVIYSQDLQVEIVSCKSHYEGI